MHNVFENFANQYTDSLQRLPGKYIENLCKLLNIKSQSKVVDLGCGSGLLTFELAKYCQVIGLDISHNMIEIAKAKDVNSTITWIEANVEKYDFAHESLDVAIAYESFHLFPNIEILIERIIKWLRPNGIISMGWCVYGWEVKLKNEILSVFEQFGLAWGEWSYQKFKKFRYLIETKFDNVLTPVQESSVCVNEKWSVDRIVNYLTAISKVEQLGADVRESIRHELKTRIEDKYGSLIEGNTDYWVRYAIKRR